MLVVPVTEVETRDLDPGLLELIGQRVEAGEPEFLLRDREGALGSRAAARVALRGLLLTPFIWHLTDPPTAEYDVDRRPRRQELDAGSFLYRETGSLYVTRTDLYADPGNRIGGRIELFVMEEIEGIDIDSEADLYLADQTVRRLSEVTS